jgi:hypothetical protein
MAVGGGIVPSSGTGQYTELTNVVRRAFAPYAYVQIYNASPLAAGLLSKANLVSGGVSQTINVQGQQMTLPQWVGYDGSFNAPTNLQGFPVNAEFNLAMIAVPVPFTGFEGLVQQDFATVSLIEARMNDATGGMKDTLATAITQNYTNTQAVIGLPGAIDDGTNLVTYENISRTTYPWFKSKVYNAGGAYATRALSLNWITGITANQGERPHMAVMGPGTWAALAQDYVGQEVYNLEPGTSFANTETGPQSGFQALMVAGVPHYMDPYLGGSYEGNIYYINLDYLQLNVHELANLAFTGFESTIPNNQIGYTGVLLLGSQLSNAKPKTCGRVSNVGYISL